MLMLSVYYSELGIQVNNWAISGADQIDMNELNDCLYMTKLWVQEQAFQKKTNPY